MVILCRGEIPVGWSLDQIGAERVLMDVIEAIKCVVSRIPILGIYCNYFGMAVVFSLCFLPKQGARSLVPVIDSSGVATYQNANLVGYVLLMVLQ